MSKSGFDYWVLVGLGLIMAVNGAFMFLAPEMWFETIPGVKRTGPPNTHFIRDIGVTYIGVGVFLWMGARDLAKRALWAGLAGGWLALHGLVHLYELATCLAPLATVQIDFMNVYVPGPLVLWIAMRAKQQAAA